MGITSTLEKQSWLDRLAAPLQSVARMVPALARDLLHGVWLGHPLHPAMVQIPVGAWASGTWQGCAAGTSWPSGG